jgi:vacuolar-type H+-ATPase subunit H
MATKSGRPLVLGVAGVVVVGLLGCGGLAAVIPGFAAPRIERALRETIAASVDADVDFGAPSATFLASFPRVTVTLPGVSVKNHAPFVGVELFGADSVTLGFDVWKVLTADEIEIRSVDLVNPRVDLRYAANGQSNLEISKSGAEADAAASAWHVALDRMKISGGELKFSDKAPGSQKKAILSGLSLTLGGDFSQDLVSVDLTGDAAALTFVSGGTKMLDKVATKVDLAATYDQRDGSLTLGDTRVDLNGLALGFSGQVRPEGENTALDLTFEAKEAKFAHLLSLVPAAYAAGVDGLGATGTLALSGHTRGKMASEGDYLPELGLAVVVRDASFRHPDSAVAVTGITFDLAVDKPEGPSDLAVFRLTDGHLVVDGAPFDGSVTVKHPETDPEVDLVARGTLDLARLSQAFPTEGQTTTGKVVADLAIAGRASDFEAARTDAVKAEGTLQVTDVVWTSVDYPLPFTVRRADVDFNTTTVSIPSWELGFGESDMAGSAAFDNLIAWAMVDGAPLRGEVDFTSKRLDLRPFQGEEPEEGAPEAAAAESSLVVIPDTYDVEVTGKADKLVTNDYEFDDASTSFAVSQGVATLQRLSLGMPGGQIVLAGSYAAEDTTAADVDLQVQMVRFDVGAAMSNFSTLAKIAPVMKGVTGSFDADFGLAARLLADLSPDPGSLVSEGMFATVAGSLAPAALTALGESLNQPKFSTIDLSGAKVRYTIRDGRLRLTPFPVQAGGSNAVVSGSTGIVDQTLALAVALEVPTKGLKDLPLVAGLGALPSKLDVTAAITGTYSKPKVEVKLGKVTEALVDAVVGEVVDAALAEARVLADKLIAEAQKASDALVAAAEKQSANLVAEAKKQGDALIKGAKGNPLKEAGAKEAAKLLDKEAEKAGDKLVSEAKKQGGKLVSEAKKQGDAVIADATKSSKKLR